MNQVPRVDRVHVLLCVSAAACVALLFWIDFHMGIG